MPIGAAACPTRACTSCATPWPRRLLDTGGTLKEVADMLRHRALNTTLIYAKVDIESARRVAMPWPGSAA